MKTKLLGLFILLGASFSAYSQNETVNGNLRVDGNVLNFAGSGGTLTLFDGDAARRNRIILGADDQGAYLKSTWGSGGTDAFSIRNSGNENVFFVSSGSNIGIGTNTPSVGLHVKRNSGFIVESEDGWKGGIQMVDGFSNTTSRDDMAFSTSGGFMFKMDNNSNGITRVQGFNVYNRNNESVFAIEETNGNVGIGTTTPDMKLSVRSDSKFIGRFHSMSDDAMTGIRIGRPVSYVDIVNLNNGVGISPGSPSGSLALNSQSTSDISIFAHSTSKNVGIGTVTPGDWKLAVNGSIRAKEIKVETGWSDFVFEKDYDLPTLKEVEEHIHKKGHLQDIPSAVDVKENGIFLGEMDSKLLQKIEELMLYTIQQQKQIDFLIKENDLLKEKFKKD